MVCIHLGYDLWQKELDPYLHLWNVLLTCQVTVAGDGYAGSTQSHFVLELVCDSCPLGQLIISNVKFPSMLSMQAYCNPQAEKCSLLSMGTVWSIQHQLIMAARDAGRTSEYGNSIMLPGYLPRQNRVVSHCMTHTWLTIVTVSGKGNSNGKLLNTTATHTSVTGTTHL